MKVLIPWIVALLLFSEFGHSYTEVGTRQRIDCLPSPVNNGKSACIQNGCIWDDDYDQYNPTVPMCYFPPDLGYTVQQQASTENQIQLRWTAPRLRNPYSEPNLDIELEHREMGAGQYIRIGRNGRFLPPLPDFVRNPSNWQNVVSSDKLEFKPNNGTNGAFSFVVQRKSDGARIWDTSIGGLLFGDQFIQIATFLPSDRFYGLGESIHHELKHDFSAYKIWGSFTRDEGDDYYTPGSRNEYGVHPFYLALEPSGKAHGVLILNANAAEYTTGPAPHFVYRTIGGQLEMFFFPGPTPEEVIKQYEQIIGFPYLPSYWAFGFRLCRWGYRSLDDVKQVVQRTRDAKIPIDVQYSDIDYMERFKDFTYDKDKWAGLPEYVDQLHSWGMKLVLIFDPPVQANDSAFQRGLEKGASFIEWPQESMVQREINGMYPLTRDIGKIMLGLMWPDYHTAWPDFLDTESKTTEWWTDEFVRLHKQIPFDGIWIDMNEPSCFATNEKNTVQKNNLNLAARNGTLKAAPGLHSLQCPHNNLDYPPYRTWNIYQYADKNEDVCLCQRTLCMIGQSGRGKYRQYDTHSMYGWSEMVATQQAIRAATGKRGSITSRSTFPTSGHYGGHWLGDNRSRWPDLRGSIIGAMEFNMFGIPQIGSDVCGFSGDTNEELCLRWQQLGAYHSYYRNHNDNGGRNQEPTQWASVAEATRVSNLFRYRNLPFLYSLHFRSSMSGGTVVRPLFFEFPQDMNTHALTFQFMWGPAMVIVPVTSPNVDSVHGYLPIGETWYSMSEAHEYGAQIPSGYSTFNAPRNTPLPTFLRGGYIIPRQEPAMTTMESRKNPFQILAGLKLNGSAMVADGEMLWDDGETIVDDFGKHPYYQFQFSVKSTKMATTVAVNRTHTSAKDPLPTLDQIIILGHAFTPNFDSATLNGAPVKLDVAAVKDGELKVEKQGLIRLDDADHPVWTLRWQNQHDNDEGNGAGPGVLYSMLATVALALLSILIV